MRAGGRGKDDAAGSGFGKGFGGIDAVVSLSVPGPYGLAACVFGLGVGGLSFAASTAAVAADCFLIVPDISPKLLSARQCGLTADHVQ